MPPVAPFAQPPGPAAAWVPYLNMQQGIRLDYPNDWVTQEQATPYAFFVFFGSPQQGPQDPFRENLSVAVQPVFPGSTLETVVQTWQAMAAPSGLNVLETSAANIAGNNAFRVLFDTPPQPPSGQPTRVLVFLFLVGTKAFSITYSGQGTDFNLFLPTVQQMIGTLQVR